MVTASGWFAARPSGTEDVYKIYAESFKGQTHLDTIVGEAQRILANVLTGSPRDIVRRVSDRLDLTKSHAGVCRLEFIQEAWPCSWTTWRS